MKKLLLSAAAAAALALNAAPAFADESDACLDVACNSVALFQAGATGGSTPTSLESPRYGTWGFDVTGMDRSAAPGTDFYRFANGAWDDRTDIPADRSSYGKFAALRDLSEARVRAIMDDIAAGRVQDKDAAKIGALYGSYMDEARIERLDMKPLEADLTRIRTAGSREALARLMGEGNLGFGRSLFGVGISDDAKNPDRYAVYMSQGGLGLPDRDYYLTERFAPQKAKYQQYVADTLGRIGWENPGDAAKAIVDFETRIAEAQWTRAESRNRDKTYNAMTVAELQTMAPDFPWRALLQGARLGGVERVVVSQNTAFPKLARIFAETPVETLRVWQAFHTTNEAAPYLSKRFATAQFDMFGRTLSGQPQQRERWKRAVAFTEGSVGESVGRIYTARYFPPESKAKMEQLVANLRTAMRARIERLDWMGPETKTRALDKLNKFGVKIGYPSQWRDYGALRADANDLYGNVERAAAYEWMYDVNRLDKPVDPEEWGMTPQTVNAYYTSVKNEIVFPAAILQAPFFDPDADPAVNYGGIGGVIGHEITHGFDDQGRKSDGDGYLRDWWTAADAQRFEAEATKLGGLYETYEFGEGQRINGRLSMGENIGDLGGVLMALDAYRVSLNGQPAPVLDGLSGDQRVFLGWAQVWRTKFRPEALRQQLVTGPHSPGMVRAEAPLRNIDAWYDAFGVKPGDKLYVAPEQRARIW